MEFNPFLELQKEYSTLANKIQILAQGGVSPTLLWRLLIIDKA
jgi:hypothetical protein